MSLVDLCFIFFVKFAGPPSAFAVVFSSVFSSFCSSARFFFFGACASSAARRSFRSATSGARPTGSKAPLSSAQDSLPRLSTARWDSILPLAQLTSAFWDERSAWVTAQRSGPSFSLRVTCRTLTSLSARMCANGAGIVLFRRCPSTASLLYRKPSRHATIGSCSGEAERALGHHDLALLVDRSLVLGLEG